MGGVSSQIKDEVDAKSNVTVEQLAENDWVKIYSTPEETLKFNTKNSYAVCAGIGKQIHCQSSSLGVAADNDASLLYDTLTGYLGFPMNHVTLFRSDGDPATRNSIKSTLASSAKDVPQDGVLLLHFSGHCQKGWGDEAVLIPADYNDTLDSVITTDDINEAVQGTKAKYFVLILDCCYAGKFAEGLIFADRLGPGTCILAACNTSEESLSVEKLGNGFFTYFLNRYFLTKSSAGEFSGNQCIQYCTPLIEAMTSLLRPGRLEVTSMTPMSLFKDLTTETISAVCGDDEIDAAAEASSGYSYILNFFTDKESLIDLPKSVCEWLATTAKSALDVLNAEGVLTSDEVYSTVLECMMKSITTMMCNCEVLDITILSKGDMFVVAYLRMCEIFEQLQIGGKVLVPRLQHMESCLQYYVRKVCETKDLDFQEDVFKHIISLQMRILYEKNKRTRKKTVYVQQDEVDAVSITHYQTLVALQNISKTARISSLPEIDC